MGRIGERLARLRGAGEGALVPFVTAGDPDLEATEALVRALDENGADLIEIGVPFSDPTADGPTIQRSSERALARGTNLRQILQLVERLRDDVAAALLLMGYANPFYSMGADGFAEAAAAVGLDGVICPDLPPEEGADLYAALERVGIDAVLLAAPTTTDERLAMLAQKTRGFLYYVSLTGVTAARSEVAAGVEARVAAARKYASIPICVGFGVSTPDHAREIAAYADGVVVGSAIVDLIEAAPGHGEAVEAVADFTRKLKAALRS